MSAPCAEAQVQFLQKIQRLFAEGEFAATYKYALILALAELAVERGDETGSALDLPIYDIGEKFAELYWRQLAQYSSGQPGTRAAVLHQNHGVQAAVVHHLRRVFNESAGRLSIARSHPDWVNSVKAVAQVVRQMPLHHLQVLGGGLEPFLYQYPLSARARGVRLKPGVAFNLRKYQGLIQQLARAGWIEHIRQIKLNAPMLGQLDDLDTFMFGSARAPLAEVAQVLAPMQGHECFYCHGRLDARAEVDHFIPWARYPRDTAHNFVLAHRSCNNDKRDMLAGKRHVEKWMNNLELRGNELGEALSERGFISDLDCTVRIAEWAYQQGIETGGVGWVAKHQTEPLGKDYLSIF
jgi:5-methylcytosine-specific restriction endonuclease McrA